MPKNLDYPFATFRNCLELADAVDDLGGSCSIETCAQKLGKQHTSGGFRMIVSSTVKYGLIQNTRGNLTVTSDYKHLKHAYSEDEKLEVQRKLFLRPEVFSNLYNRFINKVLPLDVLDKIMIREMGVDEKTASRVCGYFTKGLKDVGLLTDGNLVLQMQKESSAEKNHVQSEEEQENLSTPIIQTTPAHHPSSTNSNVFTVSITGPGVNNTFQILEEEDLEWVEVAIKKIKRAFKTTEIKNDGE